MVKICTIHEYVCRAYYCTSTTLHVSALYYCNSLFDVWCRRIDLGLGDCLMVNVTAYGNKCEKGRPCQRNSWPAVSYYGLTPWNYNKIEMHIFPYVINKSYNERERVVLNSSRFRRSRPQISSNVTLFFPATPES